MNKKTIWICLIVLFFAIVAFIFLKIKNKEEYRQKVVLSQEMRKALNLMMIDLAQARENTIQYVPADGQWHNHIAFFQGRHKALEYLVKEDHLFRLSKTQESLVADNIADLRIRRQQESPGIVEVQIKAQRQVSLIFNLKVRLHQ